MESKQQRNESHAEAQLIHSAKFRKTQKKDLLYARTDLDLAELLFVSFDQLAE